MVDFHELPPGLLSLSPHRSFRPDQHPQPLRRLSYWGYRIYALWREADDPSPISGMEHRAESQLYQVLRFAVRLSPSLSRVRLVSLSGWNRPYM